MNFELKIGSDTKTRHQKNTEKWNLFETESVFNWEEIKTKNPNGKEDPKRN